MDARENTYFIDYRGFAGSDEGKIFKATLAQSDHMLVGLNRLQPGQTQPVHMHIGEDKFYLVMEGSGYFQVGDVYQNATAGVLVWAPAALPHSVVNSGTDDLVLLVVIAPAPGH